MQRALICGGRSYRDRATLYAALDRLHAERHFVVVIAGGASGADALAEQWAHERGVATEIFPANWERYGRKAGPLRNARMLREGRPDVVIAFPGGRGTVDMMAQAHEAGVEVVMAIQKRELRK